MTQVRKESSLYGHSGSVAYFCFVAEESIMWNLESRNLGKGGVWDLGVLLVLATCPEKTTPDFSGPSPLPKDQDQVVS